jgi:hypothetical protein
MGCIWVATLESLSYTIPLDPAIIPMPHSSFFINDLKKIQPIMLAATTKSAHNQITWILNTNQTFTVKISIRVPKQPWHTKPHLAQNTAAPSTTKNQNIHLVTPPK